jgi:hypothetical protein
MYIKFFPKILHKVVMQSTDTPSPSQLTNPPPVNCDTYTDTTTLTTTRSTAKPSASHKTGAKKMKLVTKGKTPIMSETVVERLKKPVADVPRKMGITPKTDDLRKLWYYRVPLKFDISFMAQPTGKQLGQFSKFGKVAGTDAMAVLGWVIDHWKDLTDRVRYTHDLKHWPKVPDIAWLLIHAGTAVDLYHKAQIKTLHLSAKMESYPPEPVETKVVPIVKDAPLSHAEFLKVTGLKLKKGKP